MRNVTKAQERLNMRDVWKEDIGPASWTLERQRQIPKEWYRLGLRDIAEESKQESQPAHI